MGDARKYEHKQEALCSAGPKNYSYLSDNLSLARLITFITTPASVLLNGRRHGGKRVDLDGRMLVDEESFIKVFLQFQCQRAIKDDLSARGGPTLIG